MFFGPPNIEKLKHKSNVNGLIKALTYNPKNPDYRFRALDIRKTAVEALGEIGDERAIKPLIDTLINDSERDVKYAASKVLGKLNKEQAVEPLIELIKNNPDQVVREYAALPLGELGDQRAVEPLLVQLRQKYHVHYVIALGKIGDKRATETLLTLLNSRDKEDVAEALGRINDVRATAPLLIALRFTDERLFAHSKITKALRKIGESAKDVLISNLINKDKIVQRIAKEMLLSYNWEPSNDTERIYWAIARESWKEIKELTPTTINLLVQRFQYNNASARRSILHLLESGGWQPNDKQEAAFQAAIHQQWDRLVTFGEIAVKPLIIMLKDKLPKREHYNGASIDLHIETLNMANNTLQIIIKQSNSSISTEELKEITQLTDVTETYTEQETVDHGDFEGLTYEKPAHRTAVDLALTRTLAEEEIKRRTKQAI